MVNAFATRDIFDSSNDLLARLDSFMPLLRTTAETADSNDLLAPEAEMLEENAEEQSPMIEMTLSMGVFDVHAPELLASKSGMPIVSSTSDATNLNAAASIVEIEELSDVEMHDQVKENGQQAGEFFAENRPEPNAKRQRSKGSYSLIEEM